MALCRGTATGLSVACTGRQGHLSTSCNAPVGAVHIFCDEGNPNSRHRVHAKPAQDLYMAVATSQKHHILQQQDVHMLL